MGGFLHRLIRQAGCLGEPWFILGEAETFFSLFNFVEIDLQSRGNVSRGEGGSSNENSVIQKPGICAAIGHGIWLDVESQTVAPRKAHGFCKETKETDHKVDVEGFQKGLSTHALEDNAPRRERIGLSEGGQGETRR